MDTPNTDRFGSFFSRVATERDVLAIINSAILEVKLHGLTDVAILRWQTKKIILLPTRKDEISTAGAILMRIAQRIDSNADQSRVVFADEAVSSLPVHDLVADLKNLLRDLMPREIF